MELATLTSVNRKKSVKFNYRDPLFEEILWRKKSRMVGMNLQFSRHRWRRLLPRVELLQDVPRYGDVGPVGRGRGGVEGGVVAALDADDDLDAVALLEVGDAVDDGLGAGGADDALVEALVDIDLAMGDIMNNIPFRPHVLRGYSICTYVQNLKSCEHCSSNCCTLWGLHSVAMICFLSGVLVTNCPAQ